MSEADGPRQKPRGVGAGLTPARPARDRRLPGPSPAAASAEAEPTPADVDQEILDLQRGRTAALIGALGRLQLSVDLLARELQKSRTEQLEAIRALEQRLDGLTGGSSGAS